MRRSRRRRAAVALFTACVFGGGLAPPLDGHEGHDELEHTTLMASSTAAGAVALAAATAASSGIGCPPQVSCGSGCVASLGSGFCVRLARGGTKNSIGPRLSIECKACDCMYVAPGPNGRVLVRKVEIGCDINFDGLELY